MQTQTTPNGIRLTASPDPDLRIRALFNAVAQILAGATPAERWLWMAELFEALQRKGVDVHGMAPCVLDELGSGEG